MVSKRQYLPITFWNPLMRQSRDIGKLCYWYNFSARNCQAGTKNILAVSLKTARAPQLPINITVLSHATLAFNITVDPYNLWDKILAAPYHSTLLVIGILWPFIVLKHQSFNVKQNSILYSLFLRSIESRRSGCESAFFRSKELLTDVRVSKTVAMVESSTSCVKLGAMGGVLPFVINCSCKKVWPVDSVGFSRSFAQARFLLFLKLFFFFLDEHGERRKLHQKLLCKWTVTFP